jgi:hypothetical protein
VCVGEKGLSVFKPTVRYVYGEENATGEDWCAVKSPLPLAAA